MSGVFCVLNDNATKSCSFRCIYLLWKFHCKVRWKMDSRFFGNGGIWTAYRCRGNKQPSTLVMTGLHCLWHSNFYLTACGLQVIHLHTKVLALPCTVALLIRSFIHLFFIALFYFLEVPFLSLYNCVVILIKPMTGSHFFFGNFVFIFIYFTHRLR